MFDTGNCLGGSTGAHISIQRVDSDQKVTFGILSQLAEGLGWGRELTFMVT